MIKIKLTIFLALLTAYSSIHAQEPFGKLWSLHYYDLENKDVASYGLFLKQRGELVTGGYIVVTDYGNNVDYREESIKGIHILPDQITLPSYKAEQ